MTLPLLRVENLATWLASGKSVVRAVDGVSFDIARGETFAILGESGCGKSMTALSILRLLPQTGRIVSGSVWLEEQDLLALPESAMRAVRGRRIAMIFQEPGLSLNPVMTVGQQIAEVLRHHSRLGTEAAQQRVQEMVQAVGIPDAARRSREYPFQLSGGMKQRVMIAIALAAGPDLLIADEPTTALDVTIQAQVLELLRALQDKSHMAILLITHDLGVVSEMAHRVAVMYAGEIVELAPRAQFFSQPRHPYTQKLFASVPTAAKRHAQLQAIPGAVPTLSQTFSGCRFAARCEFAWALCHDTPPRWAEVAPGHAVRCHLAEGARREQAGAAGAGESATCVRPLPADSVPERSALLEVADLKVHFPVHKGLLRRVSGWVKAVDGVTLEIGRGRTLALVGESGCGKTTAGKAILQLLRPTGGRVRFDGVELTALSDAELRSRRGDFQIVFQDPYASLDPRMTVAGILEEGMAALGVGDATGRPARIADLLQQVGLDPAAGQRYPHEFSGGQRQRVAVARTLAVNPRLIVCDEPTSALDVSVQAQILNLLKTLQEQLGIAYLFITHNLAVVEFLAHEVAVMYLGRIVERGGVEEVLNRPRHPYTQALLSAVPVIEAGARRPIIRLQGDPPSPLNPPSGCHFHPRCPHVMPVCRERYPGASAFSASHRAHCHLYGRDSG